MDTSSAFDLPHSPKDKILEGLNEQQKEVVLNYKGFSMVSAGPGAGKTKTIVSRTAYMIEDGVPASSILLFSFTKKAANEIKERVQAAIGDRAAGITVSTYHSFCARILRHFCNLARYKENFTIVDDDATKKLGTKIIEDNNLSLQWKDASMIISHWKGLHWTPQQAALNEGSNVQMREALVVYEKYQEALRRNNVMDFDDLLFHMVTILEQNEIVRHQIYNRYQYITADECQDSSVLDTKLIFLLTNPKTMNLCLVGDSDQAIYGFRGANVERFFQTVNSKPHKNFVLGQNYRSTPEIVEAAQSLIRYNKRPDEKTIFSKNPHGEKIMVMESRSQIHEADRIAGIISKVVSAGQAKYGDFAILERNGYISRNFEDSFRRHRIPYKLVGGVSFYNRMEVKDILSFLEFFENPSNSSALDRIINIPKAGIGKKTTDKINELYIQEVNKYAIMNAEKAVELIETISKDDSLKRASKKIVAFASRCKKAIAYINTHTKVSEVIGSVVTIFNYGDYLREYDEETCSERLMNVQELQNMAQGYDSIQELLEDISTANPDSEGEDEGQEEDVVQIMTMHASKGLEFSVVFIVSANDGIVPSWRSKTEQDFQEERRLFYVAMTRAKENLVISYTDTVLQKGRPTPSHPSQFIGQIDEGLLAH